MCAEWTEDLHPRAPKGSPGGGRWITKGSGVETGGWAIDDEDRQEISGYQTYNKIDRQPRENISVSDLSPLEHDALKNYVGVADSFRLNGALRAGKELTSRQGLTQQYLDDVISRAVLQEDMILHRVPSQQSLAMFAKMKPGDSFKDPGFISTTYAGDRFHVTDMMRILAPKGSKALVVPGDLGWEQEVILPRNSRLEYMGEDPADGSKYFRLLQDKVKANVRPGKTPRWQAGKKSDLYNKGSGPPASLVRPDVAVRLLPAIKYKGEVYTAKRHSTHMQIVSANLNLAHLKGAEQDKAVDGYFDPKTRLFFSQKIAPFDSTELDALSQTETETSRTIKEMREAPVRAEPKDTSGVVEELEALRDEANKTADDLSYDRSLIEVTDEDPPMWVVNGKDFPLAGYADPDTGKIKLYAQQLISVTIGGMAAHEIMHQKFSRFAKDGKYSEYLDKAAQQLEKDDGVTSYSKDWWKSVRRAEVYGTHQVKFRQAVDETLAEIANVHQMSGIITGSKVWRDLYKAVNKHWRTTAHAKLVASSIQAERAETGNAPLES